MHYVATIDEAAAQTPQLYEKHSTGFRRVAYVDRTVGSVHMGAGLCTLGPRGVIQAHLHSFEESFYILEGSVIAQIGEQACRLGPGHYGLIGTGVRHAW
ncbi:MAG: cupin domain-containing protein, partial [Anaerolineales bacterium]